MYRGLNRSKTATLGLKQRFYHMIAYSNGLFNSHTSERRCFSLTRTMAYRNDTIIIHTNDNFKNCFDSACMYSEGAGCTSVTRRRGGKHWVGYRAEDRGREKGNKGVDINITHCSHPVKKLPILNFACNTL